MLLNYSAVAVIALNFFWPNVAYLEIAIIPATVIEVEESQVKTVEGLDVKITEQEVEVSFQEGQGVNQATIINPNSPLKVGDKVFVKKNILSDKSLEYSFFERDRSDLLWWALMIFCSVVLLFGGWHGFRSLISLLVTFATIFFVLLPLLLAGYPPVLVSGLVAILLITIAVLFTYGFNRLSLAALLGTYGAIFITILLSSVFVSLAGFSGLATEESFYLSLMSGSQLKMSGLLLAGLIIGIVGVLDDVAVTQVAVVRELMIANKSLTFSQLFIKALKVGRDHVSALVNTLVLAYTGASLPLILLAYQNGFGFWTEVSREVFALEIIRSIVGSLGLISAVPLATIFAAYIFSKYGLGKEVDIPHHSHHHRH